MFGVGVAVAATGLRYLIQAGKRMKEMEKEESELKKSSTVSADTTQFVGKAEQMMGPAFGLDFGPANIRLAVCSDPNASPIVIESKEGFRFTPAMLFYDEMSGQPIVGNLAKTQRFQNRNSTIRNLQPLIGLQSKSPNFNALSSKVKQCVKESDNGHLVLEVGGKSVSVDEAVSALLENMKRLKDHKIGEGGAVTLSHPSNFNATQINQLEKIGSDAKLNVCGTVEEPIAAVKAAIEFGYLADKDLRGIIAVVDVGGGVGSCSLVDLSTEAKVVGKSHDYGIGGDYMEDVLVREMNEKFMRDTNGLDLMNDPLSLSRLYEAAESSKVELSLSQKSSINIPFITADQTGPKHFEMELSRAKFEQMIDSLVERISEPCQKSLDEAGISLDKVSAVLLVGGCSRIPKLQERVKSYFKKSAIVAPNAEELVVLGSALHARSKIYAQK